MTHPAKVSRSSPCAHALVAGLVVAGTLAAAGCNIVGFMGAMEESRRQHSTHEIQAQYTGLKGNQYAVLVIADRYIQGEFPDIVPYLTNKITAQLTEPAAQKHLAAAGVVPADKLLTYLYEHPRWTAESRGELAKDLGVNRLIVVELLEYRLNDPGNQYLWDGEATGTLGVCETDGMAPDEYAYEKAIKVTYPDKEGYGPNEIPRDAVATELAKRFVDRCSWNFYAHQEPYYPKY